MRRNRNQANQNTYGFGSSGPADQQWSDQSIDFSGYSATDASYGGQSQGPQLFEDTSQYPSHQYQPNVSQQPSMYVPSAPQSPNSSMYQPHGAATSYAPNPWDTSGFAPGPQANTPFVPDALSVMASAYGQTLVGQGSEKIQEQLGKYTQKVSALKYYFAVDTKYVMKKLGLLYFPFAHKDWALRLDGDGKIQPRIDVNSPDLYIPCMAFVTLIFISGLMIGVQNRFSPEQLGVQASSVLVWLCIEVVVMLASLYIFNIPTDSKMYDVISFAAYKYVGMITACVASLLLGSTGYYAALGYCGVTMTFFLIRCLRFQVLNRSDHQSGGGGNKRRIYILVIGGFTQPILMWLMTFRLCNP